MPVRFDRGQPSQAVDDPKANEGSGRQDPLAHREVSRVIWSGLDVPTADRRADDGDGVLPSCAVQPSSAAYLIALRDRFGPDAPAMEWDLRPKLCGGKAVGTRNGRHRGATLGEAPRRPLAAETGCVPLRVDPFIGVLAIMQLSKNE